jgi:hypothetical protein
MKANVVGDFYKDNILAYQTLVTTNTPLVLGPRLINNVDGISLQLINEANGGSNITGSWKIEVSNNYTTNSVPSLYSNDQVGKDKWTDITSAFTPAITNPAGSPLSQYIQAYPLVALAFRVTFTQSASSGLITVLYSAKGNR